MKSITKNQHKNLASTKDSLIDEKHIKDKGEYYTPKLFVDYAHRMINKNLGESWKDDFVVYDCCCGIKNLTKDYKFKELYLSTLDEEDLIASNIYNTEATSFQFDFLNDSLNKLPESLLESFCKDMPILFFINPPYCKNSGIGCAEANTNTEVNNEMMLTDGFKQSQLVNQFLWRILQIRRLYNLTNVNICCFTNPGWLCGFNSNKFRKLFFNNFLYTGGSMFNASEFSGVSARWPISLSFWKSGSELSNEFIHSLIEKKNGNIITIGKKILYNKDDSKYISITQYLTDNMFNNRAMNKSNLFDVKSMSLTSIERNLPEDFLGFHIRVNGDSIQNNNTSYLKSGVDKYCSVNCRGNGILAVKNNFERVCTVHAIRDVIKETWVNNSDSYLFTNNMVLPISFITDCVVYSLFTNYVVSLKQGECSQSNELFWLSNSYMLDLANSYSNEDTKEDINNYPQQRYAYSYIQEHIKDISKESKVILDLATNLVKSSFSNRFIFNELHPEYQINNWDCGWYQISRLIKSIDVTMLSEFNSEFNKLSLKIKNSVYSLGLLRS